MNPVIDPCSLFWRKWSVDKLTESLSNQITDYAFKALFYEVSLRPKPGLVDPLTTGAHQDMNLFTFIDSTISLRPYMTRCMMRNYSCREMTIPDLY